MIGTMFILQATGFAVLARFAWSLLRGIYVSFIRGGKRLRDYGSWAVVTGATDGIGKAIAQELVRAGCNVVIISRTQSKLDDTKKELMSMPEAAHDLQVETVCVDFMEFGGPDTAAYKTVEAALKDKDIGVLVNNVGVGYEFPMWFHELSDSDVGGLVKMNIDSVVYMTRLVLPGMVERKRGAILNMSSFTGLSPGPLLALYGATKSFVDKLSREMDMEYSGMYNIRVQSQAPLWIATKLASIRREKAGLLTPLPEVYAKSAMKRIGYGSSNCGYWVHDLVHSAYAAVAAWGFDNEVKTFVLKMHQTIRNAGRKKKARKAAEAAEAKKDM